MKTVTRAQLKQNLEDVCDERDQLKVERDTLVARGSDWVKANDDLRKEVAALREEKSLLIKLCVKLGELAR